MALALPTSVNTQTPTASSKTTARLDRRRDRYDARHTLWRESRLKRVAFCGRFASGDTVTLKVTRSPDGNVAGMGGVQTCGSVWACPVCSEKINAGRQSELQDGIEAWLAAGKAVMLLTVTVRHHKHNRLKDLWDALSPAWNRTTSGAGAQWNGGKRIMGDKATFGIRGFVRVVETTYGENGWHPHIHSLLFLDEALTETQTADLSARLFGRWERALAKEGFSVAEQHGIDLRPVLAGDGLADYFTKGTYAGGAAYEVTGSHAKRSGKGRTPFQLLESVVTTGDADDLDRWHEWEQVSRGRRQLSWSEGMRDLLALGVEKTDEELAEEALGGEDLAKISKEAYRALAAAHLVVGMLEAIEGDDSGWKLHEFLAGWGIKPLTEHSFRYDVT